MRLWFALIILLAFVHSALYALTNPVFEAPDEPGHLAYANFVAERLSLPNQYDPRRFVVQGHHWPLYYAVSGLLLRASGGPLSVHAEPSPKAERSPFFKHDRPHFRSRWDEFRFFALRLLGSAVFALGALFVALSGRGILPNGLAWLVAPILYAGLPQLAFVSGSLSNDGMAAMLGSATVLAAVRVWEDPERRRWIWLGVLVGLAALAKKSSLVFVPAALALPLLMLLRSCANPPLPSEGGVRGGGARIASRRFLALGALAMTLAGCVVAGPMIAYNLATYGEPLGTRMEIETLPELVYPQSLRSRHFRKIVPDDVPQSYVARLGWMNVKVRADVVWPTVRLIFGLAALSLLALFTSQSSNRAIEQSSNQAIQQSSNRSIVAFLWIAVLANVAGLVYYNLLYPQPQGRLLFPTAGALMLLCAVGAYEVGRRLPFQGKWLALVALAGWMLYLDGTALSANARFHEARPPVRQTYGPGVPPSALSE